MLTHVHCDVRVNSGIKQSLAVAFLASLNSAKHGCMAEILRLT